MRIRLAKRQKLYYNNMVFDDESPLQGCTSRGVSGALYLQSAPAGMNSVFRAMAVQQGYVSSDERLVLRNGVP